MVGGAYHGQRHVFTLIIHVRCTLPLGEAAENRGGPSHFRTSSLTHRAGPNIGTDKSVCEARGSLCGEE